MLVSETLNKAADIIRVEGLWQATKPDTSSGTCAVLAIEAVTDLNDNSDRAHVALIRYLGGTNDLCTIIGWNDAQPGAAEVIEVLRACAVIESAREEQGAAETTYADNLAVAR